MEKHALFSLHLPANKNPSWKSLHSFNLIHLMKKKMLLAALLHCCLFTVNAQLPQLWLRSFQGQGKCSDRIASILIDNNGDIIAGGYAGAHHGSADAFIMKRNVQGDTLWTYYYDAGGYKEDFVVDMAVDANNNIYFTGNSESATAYVSQCMTGKLNSSGVQQWVSRYALTGASESFGTGIAVDANGNVYTCGYTDPFPGSNDWFVIKYNSTGQQQWIDLYDGGVNSTDEAYDIAVAPNGNPTACGISYSAAGGGGCNGYVRQLNPSGTVVWTDTYTNPANANGIDEPWGLRFISGGDLLVGGSTANPAGSSNRDMFALRYNPAGVRQWVSIYTDANTPNADEYIRAVAVDDSGNVYIAGTDYANGVITRINATGTGGWRKLFRGPLSNGSEGFLGVAVDNNGGVYATGRNVYPGENAYGNGGKPNQIIVKYNAATGDSLWMYAGQDTSTASMGIAITAKGDKVYAGGFSNDTSYVNENFYTQVIDTAGNPVIEMEFNGRGDAITHGQVVRTDALGNVYCAATVDRLYANGYDVAVIKYDPSGTLLWERYYSTPGWRNDSLTHMELNPSGNLVLSVLTDSALLKNNYRLSLVTLDQNGTFLDTVWYNTVPGYNTLSKQMLMRNDGSIVVAAESNVQGGLVIYFDPTGNVTWSAKIDSTQFASTKVNAVANFPNGDIGIAGYVQVSSGNTGKGVVQRFSPAGARLWSTDIDSTNVPDEIKYITVNSAGTVAAVGYSGFASTCVSILCSFDGTTGSQNWRQVYNPTNSAAEYGVKVQFTPAGNIAWIVRGWSGFVARYYTAQYTATGTFQWAVNYSNTASDREPVDMLVEPNNRVVTAGWRIDATSSNFNYVLVGYNASGVQQFENTYANANNGTSNPDILRSLSRDQQGNFVVTGASAWDFYNEFLYKMVTIKFGGSAVGLEESTPANADNVYAYPNPSADGSFNIMDAANGTAIVSGSVIDLQGREVFRYVPSAEQIRLGDVPPGLYIFRYVRDNGYTGSIRLIRK